MGQTPQVYEQSNQPQPAQRRTGSKIEEAYQSPTSTPSTIFKRPPDAETLHQQSSLKLPKFSLNEATKWWLIRVAVILIMLAAFLPAIVYYVNRSSLSETPSPPPKPNTGSSAISSPTTATTYYTVNISVATPGGSIKISDGSEKTCEPGRPFSEGYKTGTKITVTAIPHDGWKFQRWDGYASNSNSIDINITKPMAIAAHFEDIAPPKLLDFGISQVTELCAYIYWKTAEPITTYEIKYGESPECELSGPSGEYKGTDYSARITGLAPDTSYFYKITVKDASGIETVSETKKFTTLSPMPAEVGNRAPDFALPQLGNNSLIHLSDFRGKKVLLNLWATNCYGCVLELPYIQAIHETREDTAVLTVCLDKNVENILNFRNKHPEMTFLILINQPSIIGDYPIRVMPTTFFIDRGGVIRAIKAGLFKSPEEIKAMLDSIQ